MAPFLRFGCFAVAPALVLACSVPSAPVTSDSELDADPSESLSPTGQASPHSSLPLDHEAPPRDPPHPRVDFADCANPTQLDAGNIVQSPEATAPVVDSGIPFDSGIAPAWATPGTTTPVTITMTCSRVRPIHQMGALCPTSWTWQYDCVESEEAKSCNGTLENTTTAYGTELRLAVGSCTRDAGSITSCAHPSFSDPYNECGKHYPTACASLGTMRSDKLWPLAEETLSGLYRTNGTFTNNNGIVRMDHPSFRVPASTNRPRDGTSCEEANGGMASDGYHVLRLDFVNGALRAGPLATATGDWSGGAEGMCTITIE